MGRLDAQVNNLVNSIARLGQPEPLERGIQERQVEARRLEHELAEVDAQLNQQRIELGDDALRQICERNYEEIRSRTCGACCAKCWFAWSSPKKK